MAMLGQELSAAQSSRRARGKRHSGKPQPIQFCRGDRQDFLWILVFAVEVGRGAFLLLKALLRKLSNLQEARMQ
jgi:hypothetical protein